MSDIVLTEQFSESDKSQNDNMYAAIEVLHAQANAMVNAPNYGTLLLLQDYFRQTLKIEIFKYSCIKQGLYVSKSVVGDHIYIVITDDCAPVEDVNNTLLRLKNTIDGMVGVDEIGIVISKSGSSLNIRFDKEFNLEDVFDDIVNVKYL